MYMYMGASYNHVVGQDSFSTWYVHVGFIRVPRVFFVIIINSGSKSQTNINNSNGNSNNNNTNTK